MLAEHEKDVPKFSIVGGQLMTPRGWHRLPENEDMRAIREQAERDKNTAIKNALANREADAAREREWEAQKAAWRADPWSFFAFVLHCLFMTVSLVENLLTVTYISVRTRTLVFHARSERPAFASLRRQVRRPELLAPRGVPRRIGGVLPNGTLREPLPGA